MGWKIDNEDIASKTFPHKIDRYMQVVAVQNQQSFIAGVGRLRPRHEDRLKPLDAGLIVCPPLRRSRELPVLKLRYF